MVAVDHTDNEIGQNLRLSIQAPSGQMYNILIVVNNLNNYLTMLIYKAYSFVQLPIFEIL